MFAVFAISASCRSPVPGVNEPHFLTKARHLWNPGWCPHDIFLNSANAHAVYLYLIGAVTRALTLEQTAWFGRILLWACLAVSWTRLVRTLTERPWAAVWSAMMYVSIVACGSFSGEWVVGGVEAKGFAYAACLMGLAHAGEGHSIRSAVWTGIATALHPVVGVWATLAVLAAGITATFPPLRINWPGAVKVCGAWLLCAAPGLIPAISMVLEPGPATIARQAAEIQVFGRLAHHLDPQTFSASKYGYGVALLIGYAGLSRVLTTPAGLALRRAMLTAIVIALVGLALGWTTRPASLMKFYPFRLADGLLPMVLAMAATVGFAEWGFVDPWWRASSSAAAWIGCTAIFLGGLLVPVADRGPQRLASEEIADWHDVCLWIKRSTPADAVFLTPSYAYAFKWYAERAEFAAYKDCPQDARSLIEWDRRLHWIRQWRIKYSDLGYPAAGLAELRDETGVEYLVARLDVVTATTPIYRNARFGVYRAAARGE